MIGNYYANIKPRLFTSRSAKKVLENRFGRVQAQSIMQKLQAEYGELLPSLPLLSGKPHMNSLPMVESVFFLSLYRVLKTHALTDEEIGRLYYDMFNAFLNAHPKFVRYLYGRLKYNRQYIVRYKSYALASQQRKHPEDFVLTYINGDGVTFDIGYEYTECAIFKYLQSQDAGHMAPYFCYIDFLLAKAFNRGLKRMKCLSEGDEKCEFRYRRGEPTEAGWPPKFLNRDDPSFTPTSSQSSQT